MADIKWIKLYTEFFNNRKIKQIKKMPDGDALVVIWIDLLCLSGTLNESGMFFITKDIPYTDEMFSTEFDRPLQTIRLALQTFQFFGMIEVTDNVYCVTNWEKYQNNDKMQESKKQGALRQAKYRENHPKQLKSGKSDVIVTLPVTGSNAIELELELDINKKEKKKKSAPKEQSRYNEFVEEYPNNPHGKGVSMKTYETARKEVAQDRLILASKLYYNKCMERETEPKFVKSMNGFLRDKVYESLLEEWDNEERRRIRDAQPDPIDPQGAYWKEGDVLAPQEDIDRMKATIAEMAKNGHF